MLDQRDQELELACGQRDDLAVGRREFAGGRLEAPAGEGERAPVRLRGQRPGAGAGAAPL
jgi:hypothetical protein